MTVDIKQLPLRRYREVICSPSHHLLLRRAGRAVVFRMPPSDSWPVPDLMEGRSIDGSTYRLRLIRKDPSRIKSKLSPVSSVAEAKTVVDEFLSSLRN